MRRMLFMNLYTMVYAASNGSKFANSREINSIIPEDLNPISENIEAFQPTASGHNQMSVFNCKPIDATEYNAMCNPFVGRNDEVDTILNSMFFAILKRNISFVLYNISTLREIFEFIREKQRSSGLNLSELTGLLLKNSLLFKLNNLKQILDANSNPEGIQLENCMKCCMNYLSIRGIEYENLSFAELKKRVYSTDIFFTSGYHSYMHSHYNVAHRIYEILNDGNSCLGKERELALLRLSYFAHDLILNFNSNLHSLSNKDKYPALKDENTMFEFVFFILSDILNSGISMTFLNFNPPYIFVADIQYISNFIFSLYKLAQAKYIGEFQMHELFPHMKNEVEGTNENPLSSSIIKNVLNEVLKEIFNEFLNGVMAKRIELQQQETSSLDFNVFELLDTIIHKFLKSLITTFEPNSPNNVPFEQVVGSNRSQ